MLAQKTETLIWVKWNSGPHLEETFQIQVSSRESSPLQTKLANSVANYSKGQLKWLRRVSVNVVFRSVHHGGCCCFLIETRWKVATGKHSTGECNILRQVSETSCNSWGSRVPRQKERVRSIFTPACRACHVTELSTAPFCRLSHCQ